MTAWAMSAILLSVVGCAVSSPKATVELPPQAGPAGAGSPLIVPVTPITPGPITIGPRYTGPTANITTVANSLGWYHKSLTTLVTIKAGLNLTRPITISIAYLSPAGYGPDNPERLTETYAVSTGNRFLRLDFEGNGQRRLLHLDITLSEPNPAGGVYSFNVPVDMDLDPLYDVSISPLVFELVRGCSNIGANQIDLNWYPPETITSDTYRTVHFATQDHEIFTINEFRWVRQEVSATANFRTPVAWYTETGIHMGFGPRPGVSQQNLVPGQTHASFPGLINSSGSTTDCEATLNYTTAYMLRWYPDLDSL
jgi:hypothetical protein